MACLPKVRGLPPSLGVGASAGRCDVALIPALDLLPCSPPSAGSSDSLSTSKSPPGKNSLGLDNSLSTSSEVGAAGRGKGGRGQEGKRQGLLVSSPPYSYWRLGSEVIG